ncbi:peptide transporter family 1 [Condylostylus longicornis]|uniref:peptide transporter family 1 n=1 Tax=Condylostylus longicornis TaxID=2530218 RepID=UPI00244DA650|nr:peptide transporter family 1 [Condylostylus longicornis]
MSTDEIQSQPESSNLDKSKNDWNKIDKDENNAESQKKKIKYPRAIPFIIGNEFCERFTYYGMRAILVLYLTYELNYDHKDATVIFHVFTMLVYFMCIPGAIIADSWLGKFMTILSLSCVYVLGSVLVSLTAIGPLNLPGVELTMVGLALIALGSGGIKPCVAAFGGDQFKLPEQAKHAAVFFSIFYFSINSGSLVSTTVTPILREDVHCFGKENCYPLAFGVPAVLMCVSIVIFVFGRPLYQLRRPAGNMVMLVAKTIGAAIVGRCRNKKNGPKDHWLDYAEPKYDRQLIDDIKVLLRVLVLYIPLPVFWALFDQQGSRWTLQATRMDGTLGSIVIKPDQMQLINPLLILTFIPLYEALFYPLLAKIGIKRPLQKLFCGGLLAAVAFTASGVVELELEKTYPVYPAANHADLKIFNGYNCAFNVKTNIPNITQFELRPAQIYEKLAIDVSKGTKFTLSATPTGPDCPTIPESTLELIKEKPMSLLIKGTKDEAKLYKNEQKIDKPAKGKPELQIYANTESSHKIQLKDGDYVALEYNYQENGTYKITEVSQATYSLYVDNVKIEGGLEYKQGGVYALLISKNEEKYVASRSTITQPNSVHMLWLVPQYVTMTLGEVMFSVTGLEFSYSQAPKSMKSVLQACWLLTVAFGNVIVVIIAEAKIFSSQAFEFFLFAGLMFVDMFFFAFLAYRYKPNVVKHDSEEENIIEKTGDSDSDDNDNKTKEKPGGADGGGIQEKIETKPSSSEN